MGRPSKKVLGKRQRMRERQRVLVEARAAAHRKRRRSGGTASGTLTPVACTRETPVPSTSEAPVPSTSEAPVPSTSEAPVPSTREAPVPSTSEAPVPSTREAPVPSTSETPVPSTPLRDTWDDDQTMVDTLPSPLMMVNNRIQLVQSKRYSTPRRPFKKPQLDQKLKLVREYGLHNKRELWIVKMFLAKIRKAARELLTLDEKDARRLFQGNALLRRLVQTGVLEEGCMKLDNVLGLKLKDFLEHRLQTQAFKLGLAKSIHHARVLIKQGHIRYQDSGGVDFHIMYDHFDHMKLPQDPTSSSIDAVVTSMVASSHCQSVTGSGRKLPPQVKLVSDDTLGLDMLCIIAEQEVENTSPHMHGFSMLTRTGTLVHTKLSENSIMNEVGSNQYQRTELLRPSLRGESEENAPCSIVWNCAYCHLEFTSSEAVGCHQEKDCTENPNSLSLPTTTSQCTVDALMSPLRQPEDPTYEVKIERDSQRSDDIHDGHNIHEGDMEDTADCETTWNCAVCGCEFTQPKDLNQHHITHSVHELSLALFKFTTPLQKVKKSITTTTLSSLSAPTTVIQSLQNSSSECRWNKDQTDIAIIKIEEELVDDPGDTPPQTPPQENIIKKTKKKPGPKPKPREKTEKRKYVRKLGEGSKPLKPLHQRQYKIPPAGQGSRDSHTCYVCNKVLSCRGNLNKHVILHKEKKPWECDLCGMGFNAKRDWDHHYLQHHTNKRPNICEVCGKGYVDSYYLSEHMEFHREERPFPCDICGKLFRTSRCISRHKKRHEKDKKFTCVVCFKAFAVKGDLTSHIRKVHRSDKKSQSVKHLHAQQQQPQLVEHQQQDQESQQAKLKDLTEFLLPGGTPSHLLPGKGYLDGCYLSEHMVFHREERPFSCDICGKVFRTARCVSRHKKRHEKDKKFSCAVRFKFDVKEDLTSHIRKVHRNDKKSQSVKHLHAQQQQPQPAEHQQQDQEGQQAKSKDFTEYLLPGETPSHLLPEQLLPSDLESASLSGSTGGPGVVSSVGDKAANMINNADEEVAPHTVPSTDGLIIMYATPASAQQVGNIDGSRLDDMQHLSSSLGSSLVSGDGQLQDSGLHQHQGQDTQAITTDESGLDDSHRSELSLSANARDPTGEIATESGHDPAAVHTTHDPNSGFHLELLSQTIQLELQRTQNSSTGYLE